MSQEDQIQPTTPAQPDQGPVPDVADISVRQTRSKSFSAWAGTSDDLILIYDRAASALTRKNGPAIDEHPPWSRALRHQDFIASAKVGGLGNLERTGDLKTVLSVMDVREVRSVKISNSTVLSDSTSLTIAFGTSGFTGVDLSVDGSDPNWVSGTYETLVSTIAHGVPRWRFALSFWFQVLMGLIFAVFLSWVILLSLHPSPSQLPPTLTSMQWFFLGSWICGGLLWSSVKRRIFRRFELLNPGQRSSGRRFGGLLLLLIGLIASLLGIWSFLVR